METAFGKCNWAALHKASHGELSDSIACGGLGNTKAKYIKLMLAGVYEKYGSFSLDHLHQSTDDEGMQFVSFELHLLIYVQLLKN